MQGRCAECGLDFAWADVLNPMRGRLPGLVEHSRGVRQFLRWTITTFFWAVLPQRFWARVKMHHAVRSGRIVLAGAITVVLAQAVGAGTNIALGVMVGAYGPPVRMMWSNWGSWGPQIATRFLTPFADLYTLYTPTGTTVEIEWNLSPWIARIGTLAAFVLAWPALFVVLPATRKHARLRWAHVWRAALYPLWSFGLLLALYHAAMLLLGLASLTENTIDFGITAFFSYARFPIMAAIAWTAAPVWTAAWWYFAIVHGWKLERGRSLWLVLLPAVTAASAVASVALWYISVVLNPWSSGTSPGFPFAW
jgi:hypothetical protein